MGELAVPIIGALGSMGSAAIGASQPQPFGGGGALTTGATQLPGMAQIGLEALGDVMKDKYSSGDPEPPEGYESSPEILTLDFHPPAIPREIEQFDPTQWGGLLSSRFNPNGRGY